VLPSLLTRLVSPIVVLPVLVAGVQLLFVPTVGRAQGTAGGRPTAAAAAGGTTAQSSMSELAAYTEEQADRGEGTFRRYCVECHTRADMANADFRAQWNGRSALDLFELIRSTMPESSPGALSRGEYADIVAYFLRLNGVPAGRGALTADADGLKRARLALNGAGQR